MNCPQKRMVLWLVGALRNERGGGVGQGWFLLVNLFESCGRVVGLLYLRGGEVDLLCVVNVRFFLDFFFFEFSLSLMSHPFNISS